MSMQALKRTLSSRRFWIWQLGGAAIYAIPVTIRLVTGNVVLPVLGLLENPWIDHFVPANMAEKILVNASFRVRLGRLGRNLFTYKNGESAISKRVSTVTLGRAMFYATLWSLFQLLGYLANKTASYGSNLLSTPASTR
jgi:hypothetical protein